MSASVLADGVRQRPTMPKRLEHLAACAARLRTALDRPLRILEVGSLFGVSALVLARYGEVHCVDLWGFPHGLESFLLAVKGWPVQAIQGSSTDILPTLPDQAYDLIYLDGDHRYPVVEEDCRQALRLVTPDGLICGDDLERVLTTPIAVAAAASDCHKDCVDGYHPGVSLAVYQVFGTVTVQDGFWSWRPV